MCQSPWSYSSPLPMILKPGHCSRSDSFVKSASWTLSTVNGVPYSRDKDRNREKEEIEETDEGQEKLMTPPVAEKGQWSVRLSRVTRTPTVVISCTCRPEVD